MIDDDDDDVLPKSKDLLLRFCWVGEKIIFLYSGSLVGALQFRPTKGRCTREEQIDY